MIYGFILRKAQQYVLRCRKATVGLTKGFLGGGRESKGNSEICCFKHVFLHQKESLVGSSCHTMKAFECFYSSGHLDDPFAITYPVYKLKSCYFVLENIFHIFRFQVTNSRRDQLRGLRKSLKNIIHSCYVTQNILLTIFVGFFIASVSVVDIVTAIEMHF